MLDRVLGLARQSLRATLLARGYSPRRADAAEGAARAWADARVAAVRRRSGIVSGYEIVWPAAGRARLSRFETPLAGPGEVTVRIDCSIISPGTERAHWLRLPNAQPAYPFRPGYSGAGSVIAVGPGVAGLAIGDAVALPRVRHASVATVPAVHAYRVPPGVDQIEAAFTYLAIISGYGLRRARIRAGEDVCIVGYGPVGALAQRLAAAAGARTTVIAASHRREAAARAGGVERFHVSTDPEAASLGAPVVVEATGSPDAIAVAMAACEDGGRVVLLGSPRGSSRLPLIELREKRLELLGAHISALPGEARQHGSDWLRELGEAFLQGLAEERIRVADLAEARVDPREPERFYRRLATDPDLHGAWLDWAFLPVQERSTRDRVLRPPDLRAAGLTEHEPLPPPGGVRGRAATGADPGPVSPTVGNGRRRRDRPLRFALLGCGDIGFSNAQAIAAANGAELVAAYDTAPELARAVAERIGGRVAASEAEVFEADDVDAVFVATPHHLHASLAIRAARSGLHVIVEKPLANDLASAVRMVEVARAEHVALSVCFPFRYEEHVTAARGLIDEGALGEPRGALITYAADKPESYWIGGFSGRAATDWRARRSEAGGGVLIMNLCHYFDLVRHLCSLEAELVSAATDNRDTEDGVEESVSVSIQYNGGAVGAAFGSSSVRGAAFSELRLWGSEGQLVLEPEPRLYSLRALDAAASGRWYSLPAPGALDVRAAFIERFAAALREERPPDVTGEDGLAVQALIEAAYESARTRRAVSPADLLAETLA